MLDELEKMLKDEAPPPTNPQNMVSKGYDPYDPYDPYSIQEDFIFPASTNGRGSLVETLPCGQGLGMLNDLEYFRREVVDRLAVPKIYIDDTRFQYELIKAQLSTTIPPLIVDADSEIGKQMIKTLRARKFDDAMELI